MTLLREPTTLFSQRSNLQSPGVTIASLMNATVPLTRIKDWESFCESVSISTLSLKGPLLFLSNATEIMPVSPESRVRTDDLASAHPHEVVTRAIVSRFAPAFRKLN